jgi:hypothetical protein
MISEVRNKLDNIDYLVEDVDTNFERIDTATVLLQGRIVFVDGSVLEFKEFRSPDNHDYRFHFMGSEGELIRRWDNAPHHDVETFPYHVHTEDGVEPSEEKDLLNVLSILENLVLEDI